MSTNEGGKDQDRNRQTHKGQAGNSRDNRDPIQEGTWPWQAQFAFAVLALLFLGVLLVGLPMLSALRFPSNTSTMNWGPPLTVLVTLTGALITGIFVFMTFRIDRGARFEARKEARKVAKKEAKIVATEATEAARKAAGEAGKAAAREAAEVAKKEVTEAAREAVEATAQAKTQAAEAAERARKQAQGGKGNLAGLWSRFSSWLSRQWRRLRD